MVNETQTGGSAAVGGGGGGFRAKMRYYIHSGEPRHVFGGLAILSVFLAVPWYYMTKGQKQVSHQDYMDKADKARDDRLSTRGSSAAKLSTGS